MGDKEALTEFEERSQGAYVEELVSALDTDGGDAAELGRASERGRVVARRMRRHAALRRRIVEGKDRIGRAACFESANLLKILAFKEQ